ncbi:fatty acid desaturase family protein [Novosphingobium percolationis]|uniref:fatty acid desaturase family protein n=1 Tax=Novosphingobium percolationis TaxID=2871811 RepID=UPI001CD1F10F|nr:fatty acid desaturase family protein [Novosphingobium percolationis]
MIWQRLVLAAFLASVGFNLWGALRDPHLLALPAALAGWYLADLLSGLVHMVMDYRPCPEGRGLAAIYFYEGRRGSPEYAALHRATMQRVNAFERISYDFKNHHPRPDALGRRSVWRLIGSTVLVAALPLSLAGNAALLLWPVPGWALALLSAMLLGGGFAQYFHGTLHRRENPWFINALRRIGLLMTPAAHQIHHDTLQRDFATNCGWSNPVINRLFAHLRARGRLDDAGLEPHS